MREMKKRHKLLAVKNSLIAFVKMLLYSLGLMYELQIAQLLPFCKSAKVRIGAGAMEQCLFALHI